MFARTLPAAVFARRRQSLLERLGADAIAILPAAVPRLRNRDIEYPYRQDSDFYYISGFPEPEALAVLLPEAEQQFLLFCRERDPQMETWHGRRCGPQGAIEKYAADRAYPISAVEQILMPLLEKRQRIFYPFGAAPQFHQQLMAWVQQIRAKSRSGIRAPHTLVAIEHLLHPMRLCKEAEEIAVMREAARIASVAHGRAMQYCRPGMSEAQIEAEILHTLVSNGATWSYPSIVASGANSCILHYTENNAELRDGDLLLIDAGAELDGYASDITRTFPVNGRFSAAQRAIYELVLAAQQAAIAQVRPGNHFNQPHEAAVRVLTEGLVALGVLHGDISNLIATEQYQAFYMHRTGHWLGMDVHDVGDYKVDDAWQIFQPGMVTTIEPGLYIPAGSQVVDAQWAQLGITLHTEVAECWQGIGVRIEDDVLVTSGAPEILTAATPKGADEIEALMRG